MLFSVKTKMYKKLSNYQTIKSNYSNEFTSADIWCSQLKQKCTNNYSKINL